MFIIAGIVVALMIGDRRWAARGGQRGVIYDIALWVVPFGLIGGRLYHLATDWRTYWGPGGAGFGAAARIWDGGLGIWGAVALGVLGAWIGCRRRGMPLPAFLDALAPGVILAQAIGRLGNYFNQELYGRETTLPWGLEIFYRRDPSGYIDPHSLDGVSTGQLAVVVQPTFLYELLWNVLVSVILIYIDRRYAIGHGRLFASYVALYCVGRFWVELLRDDTATHIAGIRINSFTSTFVFIGAVVYIVLAPKGRVLAPKGREDPESLRGKDYAAEEKSEPEKEPAEEPAGVAAASVAATAARADAAGADASAGSVETAKVDESGGEEAEEPAETKEPEAEESEAAEPEAEEPEAELEEPGTEEPAAEQPAPEAVAEPEAEEAQAAEPEEAGAEEPAPEETEAQETETQEPEASDAEKLDADPETAETAEPDESEPEPDEAAETDESEPEPEAEAGDVTPEEPAGETPGTTSGGDDTGTRRRWALRRRSRRSRG